VRESALQEWVEMYAPVQKVDIILDRWDVPKGFAFITFNSVEDATAVMGTLHQKVRT
jgi:RNA recognition motif-containing protein